MYMNFYLIAIIKNKHNYSSDIHTFRYNCHKIYLTIHKYVFSKKYVKKKYIPSFINPYLNEKCNRHNCKKEVDKMPNPIREQWKTSFFIYIGYV